MLECNSSCVTLLKNNSGMSHYLPLGEMEQELREALAEFQVATQDIEEETQALEQELVRALEEEKVKAIKKKLGAV